MPWNRFLFFFLFLGTLNIRSEQIEVPTEPLVVVSMRQYLIEGSSRIHLYLYSLDGAFKKALTDDPGFNDLNPAFADNGTRILFTREAADKNHSAYAGTYVIDLATGDVRPCNPKKDNFYREVGPVDVFEPPFHLDSKVWIDSDLSSYQSPDGRFCIKIKNNSPVDGKPDPDARRSLEISTKDKPAVPLAGLPGFLPAEQIDGFETLFISNSSPYVLCGDAALVFLRHHLGSTEGESIWGLDLTTMKGTQISPNGARIYHPPNAPGVFVIAQARYLPLGTTGKTVNCSYFEWWDAHLKKVRYGPDLSVCYSAAVYAGGFNGSVVIGGNW